MHTSSPELAPQESAVSRFLAPCRALDKLTGILEPTGLQEEAELPGQILAEFVTVCSTWESVFHKPGTLLGPSVEILGGTDGEQTGRQPCWPPVQGGKDVPCLSPPSEQDSRKKDKLLCSQLQVVDFLQNFLAQEDIVQGLDPLASEDTSRE